MSEALLEVSDLVAGYGRAQVLHGIDLQVAAGERVGLFGPNGHGKTTLLRAISGLERPWSGHVSLGGRDVTGEPPHRLLARGLGHVPQGSLLFPEMAVGDALQVGGHLRGAGSAARQGLEQVYGLFPRLAERRRQRCKTLSGGERQMVAIGIGLMGAPDLLMLDEPTLGLSPRLKEELCQAIGRIAETGVSLLLVEQDVEFLLSLAQRFYMIRDGAIALEAGGETKLDHQEIMQMYFGHD